MMELLNGMRMKNIDYLNYTAKIFFINQLKIFGCKGQMRLFYYVCQCYKKRDVEVEKLVIKI